jgi:hypothetical protein
LEAAAFDNKPIDEREALALILAADLLIATTR